jgi:hypothetical protein
MRYVFWRMMNGTTTTDALREIHWNMRSFWTLIDINREGRHPFKEEYSYAKLLQSRSLADSVIIISEGRDRISNRAKKELRRLIARAVKQSNGKKTMLPMLMNALMENASSQRRDVLARNKLQVEAAKWFAAKANPNEFAEKSSVGLSGLPHGDGSNTPSAIQIAFVGPDGKEVPFDPQTPASEATE